MPTAALLLSALLLLVAGIHRRGHRLPTALVLGVAVVGGTFQVGHTVEHGLQVAAWAAAPSDPPWLSPWAGALRDALVGARPALGTEVLHLLGNLLALAGVLAATRLAARGPARPRRPALLRAAAVLQFGHVVEHVALTAGVAVVGHPVGLSTGFGLVGAGPGPTATRVLLHFAVNAAVTGAVLLGVGRASSQGRGDGGDVTVDPAVLGRSSAG